MNTFRTQHHPTAGPARPRRGGTLTEVLMAIMIMSIGVVSVATMFPLSMMKSIQATQLTSSTVLRYNAESVIDSNKLLIFDPDGDRDDADGDGVRDNAVDFENDPNVKEHYNSFYVIDPVGYFTIKQELAEGSEASNKPQDLVHCWLGNDGTNPITRIRRYPGFRISSLGDTDGNGTAGEDNDGIFTGQRVTGLMDSWVTVAEGAAESLTNTSVTLPAGVDLTGITTGEGSRVLIFNTLGNRSQVRQVSGIAGNALSWDDDLPTWLTSSGAGTVLVQAQEFRYTWMLLVRRQPMGDASVEVVCFQGRPYASKDEQAFSRDGAAQISDPDTTRPAKLVFHQGSDLAYVQFPSGPTNRPWIQKNGFVLDIQSGHFYRIQGFREVTSGSTTEVMMQLDRKAAGNGNKAVFMRGIVDVYPIGVKTSAGL